VTRERPGELAELLRARGAAVIHVPLIATCEPVDGGAELRATLSVLHTFDWLVVTSAAGAERVGDAAARSPDTRLAAVGSATARALRSAAGRPVDLVPGVQRADRLAEELVAALGPVPKRVLVVQADRADDTVTERLAAARHLVTTVVGYRTVLQTPDPSALAGADALLLASGSAARAWVGAVGVDGPPIVVAIGPTTAGVAEQLGLKVTATATDHSLDGLVIELERSLVASAAAAGRDGTAIGANDQGMQDSGLRQRNQSGRTQAGRKQT
jgi:uroporphyrinogen-III synthase